MDSNHKMEELAQSKAVVIIEQKETQKRIMELEENERSIIDLYESRVERLTEELKDAKEESQWLNNEQEISV